MKIISEEKIIEESKDHAMYYGFETDEVAEDSFRCGVYFAESELQNLAIEFAEWKDKNFFESERHHNRPIIYLSFNPDESNGYYLSQLFDKFINQRNK